MIQHGKASAFLMAVATAVVLTGSLGLGSGSRATAEELPREAVLPVEPRLRQTPAPKGE